MIKWNNYVKKSVSSLQFFHLKVTLINERGKIMKLEELAIGKSAVILSVGGEGALRQHFLDMGLIQGTEITMVKYAPMGDPNCKIKIHSIMSLNFKKRKMLNKIEN